MLVKNISNCIEKIFKEFQIIATERIESYVIGGMLGTT